MMRDAEAYFARWHSQMQDFHELVERIECELHQVVVLENDSSDATISLLEGVDDLPLDVENIQTGEKYWGSVDDVKRWSHLANLCESVRYMMLSHTADLYIYAECDLIWQAEDVLRLITEHQRIGGDKALSPMLMQANGEQYYDTWGTRDYRGTPFKSDPPFSPHLVGRREPLEMHSVAGMTVVTPEILKRSTWIDDRYPQCYRSWNLSMREAGFKVMIHPAVRIRHP